MNLSKAIAADWRSRSLHERFHEKYVVDPRTGCWNWVGASGAGGYGRIRSGSGAVQATHVALEMAGNPKPADKPYACHLCDNRHCVNPAHLWWGTASDNMLDMHKKQRHWASLERCPNGHSYRGQRVRPSEMGRRRCHICSAAARKKRDAANFVPGVVEPRWTADQKIEALTLHCAGKSNSEIAARIGKTAGAVGQWLRRRKGVVL